MANPSGRPSSSFLTLSLLSLLSVSCGDTVILRDQEGAFSLRYRCEEFRPVARSTSEFAVVRDHAIRAVSYWNREGNLEPVRAMMAADAEGKRVELERLVADYMCKSGLLADPIPKEPREGPTVAELRRQMLSREGELDIGTDAPSFRLPILNADFFEGDLSFLGLADYAGDYVFVTFGGPSCSPCVTEHRELMKIWPRFQDRGFEVLGVLFGDGPERGWEWLRGEGARSFPNAGGRWCCCGG